MIPGQVLQAAMWSDGTETPEQRSRFESELRTYLAEVAENEGIVIGPLVTSELKPGDARVPPVPDHIQGDDVKLVVGEATVVAVIAESYLVDDLEPDDLARLRAITRKAYARHMPAQPRLTDRQCDTVINRLGPEAAADALRDGDADILPVLH